MIIPPKFFYIWNEWFKSLDEIAYDPRCEVDKTTFFENLNIYPVEEAVKKIPSWTLENIEKLQLTKGIKCTPEQLRQRLKQGFPLKIALQHFYRLLDAFLWALDIDSKTYKRAARKIKKHYRGPELFKYMGTPVPYESYKQRITKGWPVKVAALLDFRYIIFGQKYKTIRDIQKRYPWVYNPSQGTRTTSFEQQIAK